VLEPVDDPGDRVGHGIRLGRSRMHDDAVGTDRIADAQRVQHRVERLLADLAVLGGQVDQVDRVDHDRLDRAVGHQLAERLDVRVLVVRRPPHPRRLVEDLDRVAAGLDAARVRLDQASRGRHVPAD
jgi:hypothetical protein